MMKKFFLLCALLLAGYLPGFAQNDDITSPPPPPPADSFIMKEEMPQFPGGPTAFLQFLRDSIRYLVIEKEKGLQGTVYVQFTVEKDGSITDVKTVKGVPGAPGLSKEAERVIGLMPKWTPGKLNGKPVRVVITQPIKFILKEDPPRKKKRRR